MSKFYSKTVIQLLGCFLLISSSCKKDSYPNNNYPHITTLDVSSVSEKGATFNAGIDYKGNSSIIKQGFVWGLKEYLSLNDDSVTLNEIRGNGSFSIEVTHALPKGKQIYYCAFAQNTEYTVFGNIKSYISEGTGLPLFTGINPNHGFEGDTISITGNNFSRVISNYELLFGELSGKIIAAEKEKLTVCLPKKYSSPGTVPVKIKLFDTWYSPGNIILDSIKIIGINPLEAFIPITEIEISINTRINKIEKLFLNDAEIKNYTFSDNTIRFKTPISTPNGKAKISVQINGYQVVSKQEINFHSPWVRKEDCPEKRSYEVTNCGFSANGKAYYFLPVRNYEYNLIWEYNPAEGEWTQKRIILEGMRAFSFSFAINQKGYFGAGELWGNETKYLQNFEYDPDKNIWIEVPGINKLLFDGTEEPASLTSAFGIGIQNKGYLIGGHLDLGYTDIPCLSFEQQTKEWNKIRSCKEITGFNYWYAMAGFEINGKIYIGTGVTDKGLINKFWRYDPESDNWSAIADLPSSSRKYAVGFSINGKGYIGLGNTSFDYLSGSNNLNDFWEYNPETDTWAETASFPAGKRSGATAIVINNKAYVGFGNEKNDLWEFSPFSN